MLDKIIHFLGCYAVALTLYMLTGNVYVGMATALAVGIAKEWRDSRRPGNYWSWGDILADVLGVLAFVFVWYIKETL